MNSLKYLKSGFLIIIFLFFSIRGLTETEILNSEISSRLPNKITVVYDFMDQGEALILLSGQLPNSCYSKQSINYKILDDKTLIHNLVSFHKDNYCNMVLKKYQESMLINDLTPGTYDIYVEDRFKNNKKMAILEI